MLATFVQEGFNIDYTPVADVAAGDVVVQADLVGVANRNIKANEQGALAVAGVFDFPKAAGAGVTFAAGAKAYWDDTNNLAVADGGGANKLIGKAVRAAANGDSFVRIWMSQ
jgi:predicted RecA/RadA family phage recombinase